VQYSVEESQTHILFEGIQLSLTEINMESSGTPSSPPSRLLAQCSKENVADAVESLGPAYADYAKKFIEKDIDGVTLIDLLESPNADDFNQFLVGLGFSRLDHRTRLKRLFNNMHTGSPNVLAFPDCLNGGTVFLALVPDGILQSPKQLRAQIMGGPLKLFKHHKWVFAHHRRQYALPPLGCVVAECSPCGRVRLMLPCVAFACQRLATAPADMHMAHMSWGWAEVVMERVTRGRVKKVLVRLQLRVLCCALRLSCQCLRALCV
jgi:hypothetical protein